MDVKDVRLGKKYMFTDDNKIYGFKKNLFKVTSVSLSGEVEIRGLGKEKCKITTALADDIEPYKTKCEYDIGNWDDETYIEHIKDILNIVLREDKKWLRKNQLKNVKGYTNALLKRYKNND